MEETKIYRGFVYYIAADSDPEKRLYIGSSIETPKKRKSVHESSVKGKYNKTAAHTIISQFPDWDLYVIEWYDLSETKVDSIRELRQHEQQWIEIMREDCVNKCNASGKDLQKHKAWLESEDGKTRMKQYRHKHYSENKEAFLARQKEYNRINHAHVRSTQKEYRMKHKEAIRAQQKEYNEANREHIRAQQKEYQKRNKAAIRIKQKEYARVNRERIQAQQKEYSKRRKEAAMKDRRLA